MKRMSSEHTEKYKTSEYKFNTNDCVARYVTTSPDRMQTAVRRIIFELQTCHLDGSTAILNNLPAPNIRLINGHSYISMIHVIVESLGKGNLPDNIYYNRMGATKNLEDSAASKDVYLRAKLNDKCVDLNKFQFLLGIKRSDDFDPNGSSKSNG